MSAEFPILSAHWIRSAELLGGFQLLLANCPDNTSRKVLIMAALDQGAITPDECGLLITAMQLEAE